MNLKMHHTAMIVSNIEQSIEFYRDILGMELLVQGIDDGVVARAMAMPDAKINYANLKMEGGEIELLEFSTEKGEDCGCGPNSKGKMHVCFEVDDIETTCQELSKKGISFWTPVIEITEDPAFNGMKFVYFTDPNGVQVELLEVP